MAFQYRAVLNLEAADCGDRDWAVSRDRRLVFASNPPDRSVAIVDRQEASNWADRFTSRAARAKGIDCLKCAARS
ncbi:MAG: hypothetical protein AAFY11_07005 [Cyanobacteria bacterium J06641_5]